MRHSALALFLGPLCVGVPSGIAWSGDGARDSAIQSELQAFEQDPSSAFGESSDLEVVEAKLRSRRELLDRQAGRGEGASEQSFDEALRYWRLSEMASQGLDAGSVERDPWSGDYWPLYLGMTAWRFADPGFPSSSDWRTNSAYVISHLASSPVDLLSPAEKYDLLVGDPDRSLTRYALRAGQAYYDRSGKVASWMGICHGWAPAAYREARPERSARALAADGRTWVTFRPADIKALASMLWANASYPLDWSGSRCEKSDPARDGNGRIIDPGCRDQDPGRWHLILINRLGALKKPFVIDATYDYEVWNQPLRSYRYTYFNPLTLKSVPDLSAAEVPIAQYTNDKFKAYRSPQAKSVVGIAMDLTYVVETRPTSAAEDSPSGDRAKTVRYLYDLELDGTGRILKGEWRNIAHPDFLWNPRDGVRALAPGDRRLGQTEPGSRWTGGSPMPASWAREAVASARAGQPLARILDALRSLTRSSSETLGQR